jgi:hypothetical protein
MELCEFRDTVYGKLKNQLFAFETSWDSFRPISYVGWNGRDFVAEDSVYKKDLFSPYYGYGSVEMKTICKELTKTTELNNAVSIRDPVAFWRWCGQASAVWWFDRPVVLLHRCVDRNRESWKRYIGHTQSKRKTLRNNVMRRATKRLSVKFL